MNSAKRKTAAFLPALMALFVCACGAARPSKYYQLTIPGDAPAGQATDPPPAPVTLLVGNLFSSDLYREDRIVYSTAGGRRGPYEYELWADPPTELIQEALRRELRSPGRSRAVFTH